MKQYKIQVSLSLEEDIIKTCRENADYQGFSLSLYINRILKAYLANAKNTQQENNKF